MSTTHLAAILPSHGAPLTIQTRPTPTPGPNELLIEVTSIALNPIDIHMRDHGFMIASYPAVIGSDLAGTVLTPGPLAGTRVAAFAPTFLKRGSPDHGAFQQKVLVPAATVVPLPPHISFNEAALLPMSVQTAWAGWRCMGIPCDAGFKAGPRQGMLVWGGAGSVGSAAVQTAALLGFKVYATASAKHHAYLSSLGAKRVFDYRDEDVVERIVTAVREDQVALYLGYDAVGALGPCQEVLKRLNGDGTRLVTAVPLRDDSPRVEGVDTVFVAAPAGEAERMEFSRFVFGEWLKEKLASGAYRPSPGVRVVEGGLEGLNRGLDELRGGVSGVKLVVEV
ncbi:MAG: hypothetical protein Q9195_008901 [Heterodermia aff. obscurata]